MEQKIKAVQAMQDYIGEHLSQEITLADIAGAANYSLWYSARLFKQLTGLSPADYVRRLRLSRSALKLRDQKVKVTDAAYDMGFASVDGYQRAFLREFGCNPKEYAKNPVPISLFTVYGVKFRQVRKEAKQMGETKNVFIQLINKPARKVIVKWGKTAEDYMSYCGEVGCDVWGVLTSIKSLCGEPVCMWMPRALRGENRSEYVQGAEVAVDYSGVVPKGFDIITLPAQTFLMFQGEPFAEEDYCEAITALEQSMERYDPTFIGYRADEDAPRIQLEPIGARGYIELMPVKPLQN